MIILKYAKENHQGYDTIHIKKDGWKFHPLKTSSPSLVAANLAAFFYFKTGVYFEILYENCKKLPIKFSFQTSMPTGTDKTAGEKFQIYFILDLTAKSAMLCAKSAGTVKIAISTFFSFVYLESSLIS